MARGKPQRQPLTSDERDGVMLAVNSAFRKPKNLYGKIVSVFALLLASATGLVLSAQQREPSVSVQAPAANTVKLENVDERIGPFPLGPYALPSENFTIVLHKKRIAGANPGSPDSETLAALEILDPSGTVRHRETFAFSLDRGAFFETCSATVEPLKGNVAAGLLIAVGCLPSPPSSGDTWEIFGTVNGKFLRLGKPFTTAGELTGLVPTPVVRSGRTVLIRPDVLNLKMWTGNFHVTVSVHVDWMQGQLTPAQRCFRQTGQGLREDGCELPVEVERAGGAEDLTFVRMFAEADETFGLAQHIVVQKDSRVEFLAAKVKVVWDDGQEVVFLGVDDDSVWLKVRIDGKEGWVHTQEDFLALGVPQAG